MKKLLEITLHSDLCAAVGKHYAAMIDTDTALDEFGLPFIPSRRLKGCLREVGELLLQEEVLNALFGVSGNDAPGCLMLSDARLKDYREIAASLKAKPVAAEKITELYCSVRGQTAMEGDRTKDKSLRYTRVVNRDDPITEKPLCFYAEISYPEAYAEEVFLLITGLKNIGYHRNRGLGAVGCRLTDDKSQGFVFLEKEFEADKTYEISLTVLCEGDLMLPDTNASHSLDYIPGTMLLGAMASSYVSKYGDSAFNDIFYSKNVRFGNLYPAVKAGKDCFSTVPTPAFLAKIKTAKEDEMGIYNLFNKEESDTRTYKPLKKGFLCQKTGTVTESERKIVYHNSKIKSKDEQALYMQYCLCAGQYFSGSITANGKTAELLYGLLGAYGLRFGRSKTAQYGGVKIVDCTVTAVESKTVTLKKGVGAACHLLSDVICTAKNGINTTDISVLCNALGLNNPELCPQTVLRGVNISGYNAKWNLKKPQCLAIKAGSCVVFIPDSDITLPEISFIGEKQNEGFGKVLWIPDVSAVAVHESSTPDKPDIPANPFDGLIQRREQAEKCTEAGILYARRLRLAPAQVGRITLMVHDANNQKGNSLADFEARLDSIKTKSTKQAALDAFGLNSLKKALSEILPEISESYWEDIKQFMLTALTVKKYQLRAEGKDND